MFPNLAEYYRAKSGNFPTTNVTRDQFLELMITHGKTLEQAEFQANLCQGLGSQLLVGDKYLVIQEELSDG